MMITDADIPIPIRFNPLKHHRNYMLRILDSTPPEEILLLLNPVCNNYIDIYTGTMSPEAIGIAIIDILKSNQAFHADDFIRLVDSKNGYRKFRLNDGSEWIVRKSVEKERYIHLHPAHTGQHTVRFKGSTLKTVFLLKSIFSDRHESPSLEKVNEIRLQMGLSPVKKLERNKGILNCLGRFFV